VIVAAATAAPDGSVTVPWTVPVEELCEKRADGARASIQSRNAIPNSDRLLNI
jgi:hypothetical protein